MSRAELESTLTKANVSTGDISKIFQNLDILKKAGISRSDEKLVIETLIKDSSLRDLFIKDYKSAMRDARFGRIEPLVIR